MIRDLNHNELEKLAGVFRSIDTDDTGTISKEEFLAALNSLEH